MHRETTIDQQAELTATVRPEPGLLRLLRELGQSALFVPYRRAR